MSARISDTKLKCDSFDILLFSVALQSSLLFCETVCWSGFLSRKDTEAFYIWCKKAAKKKNQIWLSLSVFVCAGGRPSVEQSHLQ